jgi:hypothetical protein
MWVATQDLPRSALMMVAVGTAVGVPVAWSLA